MYEEYYNPDTGAIERKKLSPKDVVSLLEERKRPELYDLNLVYKRQTKKSLFAVRLYSFVVDKKDKKTNGPVIGACGKPIKERVVKFQIETGTYDQNKQQGDRMTSQMRFNMDVEEFAYFCDIMRSGRIMSLIRQAEGEARANNKQYPDPAYRIYKEIDGVGKEFKIRRGKSADVMIETSQKPAGKGGGPQVEQVYNVTGLSKEEAGMIGAAGALALETLNMWYAFGKAEENLAIINARPRKERNEARTGQGYQQGQNRQLHPDERYEQQIAAGPALQDRGFGGYGQGNGDFGGYGQRNGSYGGYGGYDQGNGYGNGNRAW